ncbi:hypothetical protein H4S07_005707 [Coemansia furcata]|uniref:Uncharacterized protein n=1 Tax=Coemansia furcata TaxID=417177 RepID=A0ACC1L085_9FUNG|nr:hypothetical protein H4S07_005707 [Coemansia furcata]
MANSHVSVSEAFPERRPISRRLSSKRQTVGRIGAAPYHRTTSSPAGLTAASQSSGVANKQSQKVNIDRRLASEVLHASLSFDKRSKSFGGTTRLGVAEEGDPQPQAERLDLQLAHAKQQHPSRYVNGNGSNDRIPIDRRSEDIAIVRRSSVSCSQSSSPISLMSGSPTEASSPPKKAKTASL